MVKGSKDLVFIRQGEDINGESPKDPSSAQGSSIGVGVAFEKVHEVKLMRQVVTMSWGCSIWVNHQAWVRVGSHSLLTHGIEDLKLKPFFDQFRDKTIALEIPPLPLNLDQGKGIANNEHPGTASYLVDTEEIFAIVLTNASKAFRRPVGESPICKPITQ